MVNGLNLSQFLTNRPGPVQRDTSNPFEGLGELGLAMAQGRRANTAQDMQREELALRNRREDRAQDAQERQIASQERRSNAYMDLTRQQEARRERQAQFERDKLADAQHESLLHDLYAATSSNDPRAIQYAIDALHRAGYSTEQMEHVSDPPVSPASVGSSFNDYDPTLGGTLQSEFSSMAPEQSSKPPLPGQSALPRKQSAQDKQTSAELDSIENNYLSKLSSPLSYEQAMAQAKKTGARGVKQVSGGWAPLTPADDREADASNAAAAKTSAELDKIEADYLPKLQSNAPQPAHKRFLPGQQIVLGSGDSYNNLK